MKKNRIAASLIVVFVLFTLLIPVAFGENDRYIYDSCELFSTETAQALNEKAKQYSEQYNTGIYFVSIGDYRQLGETVSDAAEKVYEGLGLGMGSSKDGVLLFLSMNDRDYNLLAFGSNGNYAFTDYGKDKLAEVFLDNFRNNDWSGGVSDYISGSATLLDYAAKGEPIDYQSETPPELTASSKVGAAGVSVGIGYLISTLFTGAAKSATAKKVQKNTTAQGYVASNPRYIVKSDTFTHRTTSVRRIQQSPPTSGRPMGGGYHGGTSINSHGYSHKSGKF